MHGLETLVRLNREAEERTLALAYGRAMIANERTDLGPDTRRELHERIRRLRVALLALQSAELGGSR